MCIWIVGFVIYQTSLTQMVSEDNVVVGKDFMAFYLAGRIISEGHDEGLYEYDLQKKIQDQITSPEAMDGVLYFINPAPVAVVYSVLAWFPYRLAFYFHTFAMLMALSLGFYFLRRHLVGIRQHLRGTMFICAAWLSMMQTVLGGQNAALTFMLLSLALASIMDNKQWLSGLALGVLLFKPQYALPAIGLLLLRKNYLAVGVACSMGGIQYVVGGLFYDWDWPAEMLQAMGGYYHEVERVRNGATHISLIEVIDYSYVLPLENAGRETLAGVAKWCGYTVLGGIVGYLIWIWRTADPKRPEFKLYWALLVAAMLVISLHTQYYDAALLILPVVLIIDHLTFTGKGVSLGQRITLMFLYVCGYYLLYRIPVMLEWLRFQLAIFVPIGFMIWAHRLIMRSQHATAPTSLES